MTHNSWDQVAATVRATVSWLTYFGTEALLADAAPGLGNIVFDGVDVVGVIPPLPEPPAADIEPIIDWSMGLHVPGLFHICHNMTEDLVSMLEFGVEFVAGLTNICDLISRRWSKQRLPITLFFPDFRGQSALGKVREVSRHRLQPPVGVYHRRT